MRIKLDENLPVDLASDPIALGHDVDTVPQEGLRGQNDTTVWEATQRDSRFFVTQDLDFSDVRRFAPGSHHGLLLVRLRNPSRGQLIARVLGLFQTHNRADWGGCGQGGPLTRRRPTAHASRLTTNARSMNGIARRADAGLRSDASC